ICAAPTDVAAHPLANFVITVGVIFLQKRNRRANLSGRAVTALKSVLLDECGLHGMQAVAVCESFNSGDFIAFVHHCERETGIKASPVYQNRARATLPVIATLFRSGKVQAFPQRIEQRHARIEVERVTLAIDPKVHIYRIGRRSSWARGMGLVDWSGTEKTRTNCNRRTSSSNLFYKLSPRLWMTGNPKFVQSVGFRLKRLL